MNEHEIRAEARLQAIEYLLANLYAKILLEQPDPKAAVESGAQNMLGALQEFTVPGAGPALSDLVAAEVQGAIERLLIAIQQMVKTELRQQ